MEKAGYIVLYTVNNLCAAPEKWSIFVKPVKEKAFQGRIVKSLGNLAGCAPQGENLEVLCSEIVDIKREWRGFVIYDELVDIRPYAGDWHYNYDSQVVDRVMQSFKTWDKRPMGCSIDFACVEREDGRQETIFLEMNDGYSLGNYGLPYREYAKLISARWAQLLDRPDELLF